MTKIAKCPFCGDTARVLGADEYPLYAVHCYRCEARGAYEETEQSAIEVWNIRKGDK